MRLLRLYLGDYRVLRDLDIRFGPPAADGTAQGVSYGLDFLVGVNSTGKSTVLQAVADLMRKLERHAPIPYAFELEYDLGPPDQARRVKLSNRPDDFDAETPPPEDTVRLWVDGKATTLSGEVLPPLTVAFTTGDEAEWERIDQAEPWSVGDPSTIQALSPLDQALRELPGRPTRLDAQDDRAAPAESRFLLVRAWQLPLVTLCGLLTDMAEEAQPEQRRLRRVLEEANIGTIRGFSLKFRMHQEITSVADRETVRLLARYATRALRLGTDYLLVFDLTGQEHDLAQQMLKQFSNGLQLFKTLARMATAVDNEPPVLQQVNLFLERPIPRGRRGRLRDRPPLHLFEWLSDGEQSFLGRLCLFTLLGTTEALILLDEPEVHFNDYWKRQIVHLLDAALKGRHSHALITTHSSITLTDVPREDIVVLSRGINFTSSAAHPGMQTLAADPSDIMVHVFGAPVAAGAQSVERIEQALKIEPDQDPAVRRDALEKLLAVVGPGYWSYRIRRELLGLEPE
jgi:energy-coupling factor transporter ATP-binding protein EcfA2